MQRKGEFIYMDYLPEENEQSIEILVDHSKITGTLIIPQNAKGIVIFAHGSGSSRHSPRNKFVAKILQENNLATLLFDLLTSKEEAIDNITAEYRFNIELLSQRLLLVTEWILKNELTKKLKIGFFGASTGASATLIAASFLKDKIKAIVSRGGRPDLAKEKLYKVISPTLLIVGGNDLTVIELNKMAYDMLKCEKILEIIPGASHLFEEPNKLEEVAKLASSWFKKHLK